MEITIGTLLLDLLVDPTLTPSLVSTVFFLWALAAGGGVCTDGPTKMRTVGTSTA